MRDCFEAAIVGECEERWTVNASCCRGNPFKRCCKITYMVSTPNTDSDNLNPTIIFVYNAKSGLLNAVIDYTHKIMSPKTYACNLCAVTFGNTGMKGEWKTFISTLGVPVEFLHRDEFLNEYPAKDVQFPAAFLKNGSVSLFITHTEINACETLEDLMDLVTKKMEKIR